MLSTEELVVCPAVEYSGCIVFLILPVPLVLLLVEGTFVEELHAAHLQILERSTIVARAKNLTMLTS